MRGNICLLSLDCKLNTFMAVSTFIIYTTFSKKILKKINHKLNSQINLFIGAEINNKGATGFAYALTRTISVSDQVFFEGKVDFFRV